MDTSRAGQWHQSSFAGYQHQVLISFVGRPLEQLHVDDALEHASPFRQNQGSYFTATAPHLINNAGDLVIDVDVDGVFFGVSHYICAP